MQSDREKIILETLKARQSVDVKYLCQLLYASESTVRRTLTSLEKKGLIIRSHGKALDAGTYADKKIPFAIRENVAGDIKELISAQAVADCVFSGAVIMLDASSTAMRTIEPLKAHKDVIVITSGIKTLFALTQTNIKYLSTGGQALNASYSFIGQTAIDTIKNFNADVCFLSCREISASGYVTDTSVPENEIRKAMMQNSKRKVLLIDSTKIGNGCWHNLCSLSEFDDVYCDKELPPTIAKTVKNFHLVKQKAN